jgi:hypothetical protein
MAERVVESSEELLRVVAMLEATPRAGAAALALALGRVCRLAEVDLDAALSLVRLAHEGGDLGFLGARRLDEELFERRPR